MAHLFNNPSQAGYHQSLMSCLVTKSDTDRLVNFERHIIAHFFFFFWLEIYLFQPFYKRFVFKFDKHKVIIQR
jgi:hypothetical protein